MGVIKSQCINIVYVSIECVTFSLFRWEWLGGQVLANLHSPWLYSGSLRLPWERLSLMVSTSPPLDWMI